MILLNKDETPYDRMADIRFFNTISEVLPPIIEKVKAALNYE